MHRFASLASPTLFLVLASTVPLGAQDRATRVQIELGESLLGSTALSDPGRDFRTSCNTCHATGEDPRNGTRRFYTDGQAHSLLPGHGSVSQETTLRNTPTLLDLADATRFGWDGRYGRLEEATRGEMLGPHLGWGESSAGRAAESIQANLLIDSNSDFEALFRRAYGLDLATAPPDEVVTIAARALADFVGEIRSEQTSTFDAFADINRIPPGPSRTESPRQYGGRVHGRLGNQEGRREIKRPIGFSEAAYEGFKTFFRVDGERSVGNCVVCHVPPAFTDHAFHDTGIAATEYDGAHGQGAFGALAIPGLDASRPVARFLRRVSAKRPGEADLGYWNFVDPKTAPERQEGEDAAPFLARMAGAFKTPSLRNLPRTAPYMHNGAYATLTDAVTEIVRLARLARAGKLEHVDPAYRGILLSDSDIPNLVAFLESLDEVDPVDFRDLLLTFED